MLQPAVKLEFVRRYCNPAHGWEVYVDIDPSELGKTGGPRKTTDAKQRQRRMKEEGGKVVRELGGLGVRCSGGQKRWLRALERDYAHATLPVVEGDRDIIALHVEARRLIVAEVEAESSGQPEQKLYKAIGQIVSAVGATVAKGFKTSYVVVVEGKRMRQQLKKVKALKQLGISGLVLGPGMDEGRWAFGASLGASCGTAERNPRQTFGAMRRDWLERLSGEDRHSISRQLCQMIWDAAVYRVINEAKRYAPTDKEGRPRLNGVKLYVNKFVAHPAAPESRASANADGLTITLGHLWDAHETICKVASFVAVHVLGDSWAAPLPTPQYNRFKYIDQPLVDEGNVRRLREVWQSYRKEVDDWGSWGLDDFEAA